MAYCPNTGDRKYIVCPQSVVSVVKIDYMTTKTDRNIKSQKEEHRKLHKEKISNVCVFLFLIIM
jgi:hypothetical protein